MKIVNPDSTLFFYKTKRKAKLRVREWKGDFNMLETFTGGRGQLFSLTDRKGSWFFVRWPTINKHKFRVSVLDITYGRPADVTKLWFTSPKEAIDFRDKYASRNPTSPSPAYTSAQYAETVKQHFVVGNAGRTYLVIKVPVWGIWDTGDSTEPIGEAWVEAPTSTTFPFHNLKTVEEITAEINKRPEMDWIVTNYPEYFNPPVNSLDDIDWGN